MAPLFLVASASWAPSDASIELRSLAQAGAGQLNLARLRVLLSGRIDVNARVSKLTCFPHTALMIAAQYGQTAFLEALLAAGASVDAADRIYRATALYYASMWGQEACVRALIAAGADVNLLSTKGGTPFTAALRGKGHPSVLKILLRAGADMYTQGVNRSDYNTKAWALVDAIRKLGGWPNFVRRRRATLGIWVIRKLPTVIEVEIAAFLEPPGGYY